MTTQNKIENLLNQAVIDAKHIDPHHKPDGKRVRNLQRVLRIAKGLFDKLIICK